MARRHCERGSGSAHNTQIQYDFDTTPGTSGSPVFDHYGWLVAVHHAGFETGSPNFGIRVDEVYELIDCCTAALAPPLAPPRASAPLCEYQPFPENWNGGMIDP